MDTIIIKCKKGIPAYVTTKYSYQKEFQGQTFGACAWLQSKGTRLPSEGLYYRPLTITSN